MIVSRYLSEPDTPPDTPPLPVSGSEPSTRLKIWRAIRRGRGLTFFFGDPGEPFKRLEFWTLRHPLVDRLKPYDVSLPRRNMWRGYSWHSLRYWEQLLAEDLDVPDLALVHAEPFSD